MNYFSIKPKIVMVAILFALSPFLVFAQAGDEICSANGYTIETINGVFTDKNGAIVNRDALKYYFGENYKGEKLTIDYLLNPSHIAGLGDLVMSAYQKVFDNETVKDYDLVEMLKDASEKVKTQKLLLIAHSQGNFYANSFYDTVVGKEGGVPAESIGVYAVATPASRVAGGGQWLTSDTDKIIADWVSLVPFKKIMAPNTSIVLAEGDDSKGHNFSGVYLKHRGSEIVSAIQSSLDKLQTNKIQNKESPCLAPPKLTFAHKVEGKVLAVVDPKAKVAKDAIVIVAKETYQAGAALAKGVYSLTSLLAGAYSSLLEEDKKPTIKTYSLWVGPEENNASGQNVGHSMSNTDKIVLAEESLNDLQKQLLALQTATPSRTPLDNREIAPVLSKIEEKKSNAPATRDEPRIFFVGLVYPGFGGGGDGVQTQIETEIMQNTDERSAIALSAPNLSAPQCAYSLATDGCLLATTTASFYWQAVSGSDYYAINKNGEYSTTTELFFAATVSDFSDYGFSVSAMSGNGGAAAASATSTVTVSVATIPVAINEIAWMGTTASSYDEWLELKNNTGYRINLSQWAIESEDGTPHITLSGEMSPYEYRVLERRNNTIIVNAAVFAYGNGSSQWALGNKGEELILSYSSATLDRTPAIIGEVWAAGGNTSSTTRKTMERYDSKISGDNSSNWMTWGTNVNFIKSGQDSNGNQILGTPGACNSASYANINNGENIANDLTLAEGGCYYISSSASVSASSTLAIEAGVKLSLYLGNLVVNGVISANGEADNPVVFGSFSGGTTDNKIKISGDNGTSSMNNIVISDTGGIILNNGTVLEISNADFTNNKTGVELNNNSSAIIENANFASTTNEALSAYNGSSIFVASSTIRDTLEGDAIGIYDSNLSLSSTTIDTIYDGDGIGAYDSVVSIASSTISNVYDGDGLGLYNSTTTISNVVVENVSDDGIAVYGGTISGNATADGVEVEF